MVERCPVKAMVRGSNPRRSVYVLGAIGSVSHSKCEGSRFESLRACLASSATVAQQVLILLVVGSSPTLPVWERRIVAIAGDCKSLAFGLR